MLKELPERLEKHFFVPMTDAADGSTTRRTARSSPGSSPSGGGYGFLSEADQRRLMIALQNMRMSCNSTYLLDQETDYGVKADELAALLGEMLRGAATPRPSSSASGCGRTS